MKHENSPGPWEAAVIAQIGAERAALGMTVSELAKRVGIHPGSMPRYMKGERRLDLGMVERFAEALGVEMGVFLRRVEERQRENGRRHPHAFSNGLDD